MAKRKKARAGSEKINKSALIRSYLIEHSGSSNQEVAAALANILGSDLKKGAAMVAQVKTLDKNKSGKGKRGRRKAAVTPAAASSGIDIAAAIKAGRELLKAAGSPAEAAAVIKALGG